MGKKSSSPSTQTVVQQIDPTFKPSITRALQLSENALQLGEQGFPRLPPFQTVVPFAPETEEALGTAAGLSRTGAIPGAEAALSQFGQTLGGDFLFGGPGFNAAVDAATRRIVPQVQGLFSSQGRLDSGLAQEAVARAIADPFAAQFGQERQRQIQALGLLPQLQSAALTPLATLGQVGATREEQAGRELTDRLQRFQFEEQRPFSIIDDFIARVGGAAPAFAGAGTRQTISPQFRSPLASGLGLGLTGLGLASSLGGLGGGLGLTGGLGGLGASSGALAQSVGAGSLGLGALGPIGIGAGLLGLLL